MRRWSAGVEALRQLLAREELDGPLELALEPRCRLFPRLAEPLVERLHRDLRVALDLSLGDAREPLVLAALPLDEHDVQPRAHVGLGALDRLGDSLLALAQPRSADSVSSRASTSAIDWR